MNRSLAPLAVLVIPGVLFASAEDPSARFASMTPEEVRAFEIEVMEKIADLALIPPRLNANPLPKYDYDQLDYGMTIGIERTPKGRLWACWVAGGDSPEAFFVLATSDDDGETMDTHESRSKLTAWLSEDEGKTWKGGLMLDERKGISYPDGFQAPDGTIYISYDRNRATDGEILLARFTEQDVLAGRLVSPKSAFRMLISRPLKKREAKE